MTELVREWSLDFPKLRIVPRTHTSCEALVFGPSRPAVRLPVAKEGSGRKRSFPVHVLVTESGRLPTPNSDWWKRPEIVRFVFTTERGFEKALAASGDRAFVVAAGARSLDWKKVIERLARSGVRRVRVADASLEKGLKKAGFVLRDEAH